VDEVLSARAYMCFVSAPLRRRKKLMSSMNGFRGSCILYLGADGMKIAKRCIANWISWVQRNTRVPVSSCIEDLFDYRYLPL
jgi:hypothetical protein